MPQHDATGSKRRVHRRSKEREIHLLILGVASSGSSLGRDRHTGICNHSTRLLHMLSI